MIFAKVNSNFTDLELDKMIQNYGCHCFPENSKATIGHGKPVDEIDSTCQKLNRCRRCISIEFPDEYENLHSDSYRYSINNGEIDCSDPRNSAAHAAMCKCDKDFAESLALVWEDSLFNYHYWLNNNNIKIQKSLGSPVFKRENYCTVSFNERTNTCCGNEYPVKLPYNSDTKSCCAVGGRAKLYDGSFMDCCADGSVQSIGSC